MYGCPINWAITRPSNKASGGVISGEMQNTKASKKINSRVVIVLSRNFLSSFGVACSVSIVLIIIPAQRNKMVDKERNE